MLLMMNSENGHCQLTLDRNWKSAIWYGGH